MNDISKTTALNESYINIEELQQVQYWSERLIVNQSEIIEAVNTVGSDVEQVKNYLKNKSDNSLI